MPPSHSTATPTPGWEHFEHRADIGVRGFGTDLAGAFAQAATAMTAIIVDPATVQTRERVDVSCSDDDKELLLVDWLNLVVYEMAVRDMLFSRFDVSIEDGALHATLHGEPVDRARHRPAVEVKGATFTELSVRHREDGTWVAQCVVDV